MLDNIPNIHNIKEKSLGLDRMTVINYLDNILNKNLSYNDFIHLYGKQLQQLFDCKHLLNVYKESKDGLDSSKDIRRCGVIFIKDFINNMDEYLNSNDNNIPTKIRKLLFVKGKSGYYSLPKGRKQDGESDYECASREVYEETGIKISVQFLSILPILKIDNNIYFICNLNNIIHDKCKMKYINEAYNQEYIFQDNIFNYLNFWDFNDKEKMDAYEVDEACWYTIDEVSELKANKDIRNILKKLKRVQLNTSNLKFEKNS